MEMYLLENHNPAGGVNTSIFSSRSAAEIALGERVEYIKSHAKELGFIKKYAKEKERIRVTDELQKLHVYKPSNYADVYYITRNHDICELTWSYMEVYTITKFDVDSYKVNKVVQKHYI